MLSLKSISLRKLIEKFFDDPVLYLFPVFESFYFNHTIETTKSKDLGNKNTKRKTTIARSYSINLMSMKDNYEEKTKSIYIGCLLSDEANTHDMATTTSERTNKKVKKTQSLPDLRSIDSLSEESCSEIALNQAVVNNPKWVGKSTKTEEPNFSLLHSNILYLLFFAGTLTSLLADMVLQRAKNKFIRNDTKMFVPFFVANILL